MRRLLAVALGAVVVLGGILAIAAVLGARDDAEVVQAGGPGVEEADRGSEHRAARDRAGADLPTSGPHEPRLVTRDLRALPDDEILHALELGDVVLTYGGERPPAELIALREAVAGPFEAELAAAGQAVIVARAPGTEGVQALAWRHRLRTGDPADPALRAFAEYWLGRGVSGAR